MIRHRMDWPRLVFTVVIAVQVCVLLESAAVSPAQAVGQSMRVTAAADLQAQVRSTAAKVIPAVVSIASVSSSP